MQPEIIYCEQKSDEWFEARLGRVTTSNFSKAMAGMTTSTRKTYMEDLMAERVTGQRDVDKNFCSAEMRWGIEHEQQAREYYEGLKHVTVEQVGFIDAGDVGTSPDGLVGDDGLLEIKCPKSKTHIRYYSKGILPSEYKLQVYGQLWVTGREWVDFVSFDPRVTIRPFWCIRIERDETYIKQIAVGIQKFVDELLSLVEQVSIPF